MELTRLIAGACGVLWAGLALADGQLGAPSMAVAVRPAGPLSAGGRAVLVVEVPPLPQGTPLMVTVRALGEAVEVLRGRLLGSEGARDAGGALRFEVPMRARAAGSAELRITLDGYTCDPRCHDVHDEQRVVVDVRAN